MGSPSPWASRTLRPYIVSGDKDEDFAGLARSGYGIPYDIGTESTGRLRRRWPM